MSMPIDHTFIALQL